MCWAAVHDWDNVPSAVCKLLWVFPYFIVKGMKLSPSSLWLTLECTHCFAFLHTLHLLKSRATTHHIFDIHVCEDWFPELVAAAGREKKSSCMETLNVIHFNNMSEISVCSPKKNSVSQEKLPKCIWDKEAELRQ